MGNKIILLDTSILVDLFRKKNKRKSIFYSLSLKHASFAVSTITRFEIFVGQTNTQNEFWDNFYKKIKIIDFDDRCAFYAGKIVKQLKQNNKMIEIPDILIAATALANDLPISTLNLKHFSRIEDIDIVK
ncbi:MAG: type II toxin-antitoxin system VapC family toxin [Bacteroidota bacterium]